MNFSETISVLGDRLFMIHDGRTFTYADLAREVGRFEELFTEKRVAPGDVGAVTGLFGFQAAAAFLALARNRNVVVPLVGSDQREVEARMEEAGVEWVVESRVECKGRERGALPYPLVARLREATRAGLILFSSGSTGRAKAMLHDLDTLVESYSVGTPKELRVLAFMGLDHIGGIDTFFRAIASGSCLVVPGERSPEAICRLIEAAMVSVLPVTPSFLNLMLLSEAYKGRDLSSLRIVGFGAERMPESVLRRLREVFPKVEFQQKFGTSETNAIRTVSKKTDPLWMKIADRNVEWKIVNEELWLKTPSRILGYLNGESDRLTADGWYRTGDLVEEDGEGFFQIVGRQESVINVGGEKVNPGEVEAVLRELSEIVDCRVFGEGNPLMGQVVGAEIVVREDADKREVVRAARKHSRQRLTPYKVPVKVRVVERISLSSRYKKKEGNH